MVSLTSVHVSVILVSFEDSFHCWLKLNTPVTKLTNLTLLQMLNGYQVLINYQLTCCKILSNLTSIIMVNYATGQHNSWKLKKILHLALQKVFLHN